MDIFIYIFLYKMRWISSACISNWINGLQLQFLLYIFGLIPYEFSSLSGLSFFYLQLWDYKQLTILITIFCFCSGLCVLLSHIFRTWQWKAAVCFGFGFFTANNKPMCNEYVKVRGGGTPSSALTCCTCFLPSCSAAHCVKSYFD